MKGFLAIYLAHSKEWAISNNALTLAYAAVNDYSKDSEYKILSVLDGDKMVGRANRKGTARWLGSKKVSGHDTGHTIKIEGNFVSVGKGLFQLSKSGHLDCIKDMEIK